MTERFGDRATFAVEVGGVATGRLRVVDLWVAGERLTVKDNAAYVPSLAYYMGLDAEKVRKREIPPSPFPGREPEEISRRLDADRTGFRQRFWFMQWTEIVDDVSIYAYLDDDLVIIFRFYQRPGEIFVSRIRPEDFLAVVDDATGRLKAVTPRGADTSAG